MKVLKQSEIIEEIKKPVRIILFEIIIIQLELR